MCLMRLCHESGGTDESHPRSHSSRLPRASGTPSDEFLEASSDRSSSFLQRLPPEKPRLLLSLEKFQAVPRDSGAVFQTTIYDFSPHSSSPIDSRQSQEEEIRTKQSSSGIYVPPKNFAIGSDDNLTRNRGCPDHGSPLGRLEKRREMRFNQKIPRSPATDCKASSARLSWKRSHLMTGSNHSAT